VVVVSSQTGVLVVVVTSQTGADTSTGGRAGQTRVLVVVVTSQAGANTSTSGGAGKTGVVVVMVSVVEVTSNGLGRRTSRGEVRSRVLEGLSAGGAGGDKKR
jgi:hypothetical protein